MNARLILTLIALAAVIGSALGVVHTRHESRRYSVELGQLEDRRDEYIAEWSRLQIEQAWLADAGHVESEARQRLGMQEPERRVILVVEP
ncbi:MAG: cell division protein FtsL [Xanthomonadales bacterium]|mgnify:CR=1 FL=1|nr:cell division protein FtsL [Gammaproteobacteria bacterium]MBT8060745.1 cell division protein FtsL [Gammaproteobacteria bacterium]NNJ65953.1 cell division protein FtsL [Xanthomonadales bacterium]NNK33812.1 cell division protein FtsL [Xanthomonadales bacterium]NNK38033.1 cell division protein FtsL [Xanthomonadales bacterium]